ncbi:hypothetical protein T4C_7742 [Trichinella pseudospiralis]|uniref:Uncharacterized protein n=1 Tax=Trichinella pseudospiralis TaxID=6337 RepID=A0A0V1JCT4_TRIPS|nr:hypothetical protein T4C_7742 [Trichinella pseudospiralis]
MIVTNVYSTALLLMENEVILPDSNSLVHFHSISQAHISDAEEE